MNIKGRERKRGKERESDRTLLEVRMVSRHTFLKDLYIGIVLVSMCILFLPIFSPAGFRLVGRVSLVSALPWSFALARELRVY